MIEIVIYINIDSGIDADYVRRKGLNIRKKHCPRVGQLSF